MSYRFCGCLLASSHRRDREKREETERPTETCRVLFQNKINVRYCASGWFYYRNTLRCRSYKLQINIICIHKLYRLQSPCHILFSVIFSQSLCHVQNQIQELRKDTVKVRRSQALNLGQSNTNAAELPQVSFIQ
jgi:hypothetical protein